MARITYQMLSQMVTKCQEERIKLRSVDHLHPLLLHNPLGINGEKWLLDNFWPTEGEVTGIMNEDAMQMWCNFYTALITARLKVGSKMAK